VFWFVLDVVYSLCAVWFVVALLVIFKVDMRYEGSSICRNFGYWAEFLLPILSNMCFLPIIAILLDVNLCTESVGDEYTDSFLDRD
jgi:hypothetical protein